MKSGVGSLVLLFSPLMGFFFFCADFSVSLQLNEILTWFVGAWGFFCGFFCQPSAQRDFDPVCRCLVVGFLRIYLGFFCVCVYEFGSATPGGVLQVSERMCEF